MYPTTVASVAAPVQWLTTRRAAMYAACSKTTISRAVRRGELKGYKLRGGWQWRFTTADVDAWLMQVYGPRAQHCYGVAAREK